MGYGIPIWTRDWEAITTAAAFGRLQPAADISPERPIIGFMNDVRGETDTAATTALANQGIICGIMALITNVRLRDEKQHNYLDGIDGLDMWQMHRHYFHTNPWTDLTLADDDAELCLARWIIPITLPTGIGSFLMDFSYGIDTLVDDAWKCDDLHHHLYTIYGSKLEGVQEYITHIEVYTAGTRDKWKIPVNGRLDAVLIQTQDGSDCLADGIISDIEVTDGGIPQISGILEQLRGWGEAWQEQGMPLSGITSGVVDGWPMDPAGLYFLNFDSFVPDQTAMVKYTITAASDEIKFIMKYTQPQVEVTSQVITPAVAADSVKMAINEGEMSKDVIRPPIAAPNQIPGVSVAPEPSANPQSMPIRKTRRSYAQD